MNIASREVRFGTPPYRTPTRENFDLEVKLSILANGRVRFATYVGRPPKSLFPYEGFRGQRSEGSHRQFLFGKINVM
jgi:hypothetical protein